MDIVNIPFLFRRKFYTHIKTDRCKIFDCVYRNIRYIYYKIRDPTAGSFFEILN